MAVGQGTFSLLAIGFWVSLGLVWSCLIWLAISLTNWLLDLFIASWAICTSAIPPSAASMTKLLSAPERLARWVLRFCAYAPVIAAIATASSGASSFACLFMYPPLALEVLQER